VRRSKDGRWAPESSNFLIKSWVLIKDVLKSETRVRIFRCNGKYSGIFWMSLAGLTGGGNGKWIIESYKFELSPPPYMLIESIPVFLLRNGSELSSKSIFLLSWVPPVAVPYTAELSPGAEETEIISELSPTHCGVSCASWVPCWMIHISLLTLTDSGLSI